jgi:hypothetical protein
MTKERAWPVRAIYILIAVALAMSLMIMTAPAQKVSANPGLSEWTPVDTPTVDGWVLAPGSEIIDFAVAEGGDVAYAIVYLDSEAWDYATFDDCDPIDSPEDSDMYLLKSEDGGATWTDIYDPIQDVLDDLLESGDNLEYFMRVATDGVDPDFVALAFEWSDSSQQGQYLTNVFISNDGGDTFEDTGTVEDENAVLSECFELAVSPVVEGKRNIAIGGYNYGDGAGLFRCVVTGDSADDWEDATDTDDYPGWNDEGEATAFYSASVVDIEFAPSWAADKTILVLTVTGAGTGQYVHLQFGSWGTTPGWNADSALAIDAVAVVEDVGIPGIGRLIAGLALPTDYAGRNTDKRYVWVNVNYIDPDNGDAVGEIFRVKNTNVIAINQQIEDTPWLTNVSYWGTIASGKAIAGLLGDGTTTGNGWYYRADPCVGVQVYRNDKITNMDICCLPWDSACKPPTGRDAMAVAYVTADKAYAVDLYDDGAYRGDGNGDGYDYDQSAWSVSFDDGDTWNQLSLIDTPIHYFSDVAVSPDCNKTFLVSVSKLEIDYCDSVWVHAVDFPEAGYSEYSGHWLRTWTGELAGYSWEDGLAAGMLRLAPEETTGNTVYLFDYYTDTVYWNELETLACWQSGSASVDYIVDLAVLDKQTIYALGEDGMVAMSDDYAVGWDEAVDSEVDSGWTIAVLGSGNATHVLVGGRDGQVSYSKDGGKTFTTLEDIDITGSSKVTVAFDTYFDTNKTIYAAVEAWGDNPEKFGGIYRWVIDTSEDWTDLKAEPLENQVLPESLWTSPEGDDPIEVAFTGLVVDRPGNPFTNAENGGVIYASYYGVVHSVVNNQTVETWFTGAARSLERQITVCTTCLVWDFLQQGLTIDVEGFEATPDALKICGCLTPASNTKLFAIDAWNDYDICKNEAGSVWTFEDCYAKKAPEPTTPVVEADPCSCYSAPFTLKWDTLCDACEFEIQFALDAEFTMPVKVNGEGEAATDYIITGITGDTPAYSINGGEAGGLSCETTYFWRVRASKAATDQVIHSWWSVSDSFTVPPSVQAGIITLVAPVPGALNQPTKSVGFSWDLQADAGSFTWVLSKNADLSTPLDSKNVTSKAATYGNTLDYSTTYYWQVRAYNEGVLVGASSVGTFTTAATGAFCCPIDGLCFATEAQLIAHNATHPVPGTPFWVWVVIAIGAVLVIVVIVLIFRTRRV